MAHGISVANRGFIRSHEIERLITDRHGDCDETSRHLSAIERLEARGAEYSNQDFDVLSAALRFAESVAASV